MERDEDRTEREDDVADGESSNWLRHLGPGWVEIAPGIFAPPEPAAAPAPPPDAPEDRSETLDGTLRSQLPLPTPEPEEQVANEPRRRGFWHRR